MSEVLELRNLPLLEAPNGVSPGNKNGQWESIIKPTYLYPGDSILSRQIFVDTKAQETGPETKIPVDETLFCTITFNLYNRNWRGAINKGDFTETDPSKQRLVDLTKSAISPINSLANTNVAVNDGAIYVACTKQTISVTDNLFHLGRIQFCARTWDAQSPTGAFPIAIVFINTAGVQTTVFTTVPKVPAQGHYNQMFEFSCDITYQSGGNITLPDQPQLGAPTPIAVFLADAEKQIIANSRLDVADKQTAKTSYRNVTIPEFKAPSIAKNPDSQSAGSELTTGEAYIPKQFTKTFIIEGGEGVMYDPIDLCKNINRQLTEIPPGSATGDELTGGNTLLQHVGFGAPVGNNTFNNFIQLTSNGEPPGNYPLAKPQLYGYNYNEAATALIKETTTVDGQPANMGSVYAGASQVSINFNPDTKKFSFDFLHTPIFDEKSTAVGVISALVEPQATSRRVYQVPANGGIIVNNLISETGAFNSGKSTLFFENTLGFAKKNVLANGSTTYTMDHLLTNLKMVSKNADGQDIQVNGQLANVPIATVTPGINITQGFQGIDSVLQKGNVLDQTAPFWQPPTLPSAVPASGKGFSSNAVFSSQDKTVEIEADRSIFAANTQLPFGYFLVEVNANFQTKLKSPQGERGSIVSIVSRYYSQGSYTSASADSALVYKHTGEPTILTSFNCRILNSDGELANVGGDNTVFLEIIRAPPALPSPKELKKAAEMQKKSLEESK